MVKEWLMNQDDFDRFLAWLHTDRAEACKKYDGICRRVRLMSRMRGLTEADGEEIADETINRAVRKVAEVAASYVGDPAYYCYGVARNVIHERIRPVPPVPPPTPPPDDPNHKERLDACLRRCLDRLPPEDARLVLAYYADDGRTKIERRRQLAAELGITENALRIRMTRLRATLKPCIVACLNEAQ